MGGNLKAIIDFIVHIDQHLITIVNNFGVFSYTIVFLIIFGETGLVVTPFLPGDSLLFAIGALAAKGGFNIWIAYPLLLAAAILGDACNYQIGHMLGRRAFTGNHIFKKEYLEKTEAFYDKHGGKTIILARFMPIVRTFAPFVAGVGKMTYPKFFSYNIIGSLLWVTAFLFMGYFVGNIPAIKENFSLAIMLIIVLSVLPAVYHYLKDKITNDNIEKRT